MTANKMDFSVIRSRLDYSIAKRERNELHLLSVLIQLHSTSEGIWTRWASLELFRQIAVIHLRYVVR